ncbi:MAG: metallophosphoesterase family protein [Acidobacteriaceae bacterium]|jgi:Icc-related predicted phosphoesterase|nr:metallophosphoesterase family protein [Acidobacteriaceae bacterium]
MQIGALGDIHGEFDLVQEIMARHPEIPMWVQVGDIASNEGNYFRPRAPLYWIKGNNEDFDVIAKAVAGDPPSDTLHYMANGRVYKVGPWKVAALGGTFAPSWYHTPASMLPPSRGLRVSSAQVKLGKSRDDKRRHFVRDEVLACKALTGVDVFLTHEAPRPFYPAGRRIDTGKTAINEVLTAMRPKLHLFGHHHEFTDSVRQGVRSIGLDLVTKSYLLVDAETFRCERIDT